MISNLKIPSLREVTIRFGERERVLLQLGCMDIDNAIKKDEPSAISTTSTKAAIELCENWERSNHLFVMFIKTHIFVDIHGSIEKHNKVRDL